MSMHRKKAVAAMTAALLHHEQLRVAATETSAGTAVPIPLAPPSACGQNQTAWSFSGRYEHMALRVQRQARRAG
jgi:hypothetical protein